MTMGIVITADKENKQPHGNAVGAAMWTGHGGDKMGGAEKGVGAGEGRKMDPSTAREFKPAGHKYTDGPPVKSVINYLSSEMVTISDLHWYTTDRDIVNAAATGGVKLDIHDVVFAEHKVNGKTKSIATINCRSPEKASMLVHWFHCNSFQGKRINPSYVANNSQGKPGAFSGTARAGGAITGLPAPFATNAHGGINFNRLRPMHNKQQHHLGQGTATPYGAQETTSAQHGNIGLGFPPRSGLFSKLAQGKLQIQDGMQFKAGDKGDWRHHAAWTDMYHPDAPRLLHRDEPPALNKDHMQRIPADLVYQ